MNNNSLLHSAFRKHLIEELGLEKIAPDKKEEIMNELSELVGMRLMMRIHDRLPENEHAAFTAVTKSKNFYGILSWLKNKGMPFEEMIVQEVAKVKDELKAHAAGI